MSSIGSHIVNNNFSLATAVITNRLLTASFITQQYRHQVNYNTNNITPSGQILNCNSKQNIYILCNFAKTVGDVSKQAAVYCAATKPGSVEDLK